MSTIEMWLSGELPYDGIVYHRGVLARDRKKSRELAEVADAMFKRSTGKADVVSKCGHIRGRIEGTGELRLHQMPELDGSTAYVAVRRA